MTSLSFNDFDTFQDYILNSYDKSNHVLIIGKYGDIQLLLEEFACCGFELDDIELKNPLFHNADYTYYLSLEDNRIFCEIANKYENVFENISSQIIFVMDYVSSKVLKAIEGYKIYEVSIDDTECDNNEEYCKCEEKGKSKITFTDIDVDFDSRNVNQKLDLLIDNYCKVLHCLDKINYLF